METINKQIAVIGAGISGLCSIAALKKEGLEPICFEKTDQPCGAWCYRKEPIDGVTSIMPTTVINHSKEMGALSTFPPRKEFHNYMRHNELYHYFVEYAEAEDCLKHIRFNKDVIQVKKSEDYEESGRWVVTIRDTLTGEISSGIYDGVMVCVGQFQKPNYVTYPGQDNFRGKVIHSRYVKEVDEYKKQQVVVAGMGCSALDAAVEISNVAKQVYLSTRGGAHVLNRVGPHGLPIDFVILRRCFTVLLDLLPAEICSWLFQKIFMDPRFDHRLFAVKPKNGVLAKDPIINDYIGSKLLTGSIVQKSGIRYFTETGVVFDGDGTVTEADAVIMATGYTWGFPFIEEGVFTQEGNRINLYKCIFPPHLPHATLSIICFFLPFGPSFPLTELQCRWVARILAGLATLPSEEVMIKDIIDRHEMNCLRYTPSDRMTVRVDYTQYMDEIAVLIGAKPDLWKILFTDFRLCIKLIFGPCLPYQYRLEGPHKWEGARDAIMTAKDRVLWPITRRQRRKKGYIRLIFDFFTKIIPNTFFF